MSALSELFDRDPLKMAREDISEIIKYMREARTQFDLGQKAPVAERRKKDKISEAEAGALLKDLGLDI